MLKSPLNRLGIRLLTLRRPWDKTSIKQGVMNRLFNSLDHPQLN